MPRIYGSTAEPSIGARRMSTRPKAVISERQVWGQEVFPKLGDPVPSGAAASLSTSRAPDR